MYGASRAVGIGPPVSIHGRSLPVHARTVADYARIEGRILQLRGDPFDSLRWVLVRANGSRHGAAKLFDKLRDNWWLPDSAELFRWLGTWEGRIYALWLAVRKLELEEVHQWVIEQANRALREGPTGPEAWWLCDIQSILDRVNGDDEIGALERLAKATEEGKSQGINWGQVYRELGDEPLNIPPGEVAGMTLTQIEFFFCKRERAGARTPDTSTWIESNMIRWTKQQRQSAVMAIENLSQGKQWNAP